MSKMNRILTSTERLINELNEKKGILSILLNHLGIPNFSMEESSLIILKYGWYIPGNFQLKRITELTELIKPKRIEEAENILTDFFI